MKTTRIALGFVTMFALLAAYAQTGSQKSSEPSRDGTAQLWTYKGPYRMTPPPTLYSDLIRIKIQKVEMLKGPEGRMYTKITYSPGPGKTDVESDKFRKEHETQTISFLLLGDHTAKVKEGDILRTCFYPN